MKTSSNQASANSADQSDSRKQAESGIILQAYKARSGSYKADNMALPASNTVVQRVNVGYAPANPGNFRAHTTLNNFGGSPASDKPFHNGQRDNILTDNVANGGGNAPLVGAGQHPIDDTDNGSLLDRDMASDYDPEVDHIVPRAQGGANDYNNARVVSKTNNLGNLVRPNNAAKVFRLYDGITLSANIPQNGQANFVYNATPIQAGASLNLVQSQLLAIHAGVNVPNAVTDLGKAGANAIKNTPRGQNNNVTVQ